MWIEIKSLTYGAAHHVTHPDLLFEWDENKRLSNLGKHGIDFVDAVRIFDEPLVATPSTSPARNAGRSPAPEMTS